MRVTTRCAALRFDGAVVRITWFGHSTVLIELDGIRLLTDPVWTARVAHLRRVVAAPVRVESVDAVLVSHSHYDHFDARTLRRLGTSTRLLVPRGMARRLRRRGFRRLDEVGVGDDIRIDDVTVTATHAEHDTRKLFLDRNVPALGYLVAGTARVYFAGDTDVFDDMSALAPVDVALLPVAGWGPRVPAGHLDPERAARAVELLRPRVVVPIHWGTYRRVGLAQDEKALREPAETFAALARDVDVRILPVGGSLELQAAPTPARALA
jgi:L-ascorbate metabolism protein UlaG (beta-lactamase superfamily)